MNVKLASLFVFGIFLIIAVAGANMNNTVITKSVTDRHSTMASYSEHDPIVISSNSDFVGQGWPGSGTEGNPYLIEGLNITSSSTGIRIEDTTVYFMVRNCLISAPSQTAHNAILLDNVTNGAIQDSTIELHYYGIYFHNSPNCTAKNDTAINNHYGFHLYGSTSCLLTNNTATSNSNGGFSLHYSDEGVLINNTATNNSKNGFSINNCVSCAMANNTLVNNGISITGLNFYGWIHNISSNQVNGKPLGYFRDLEGGSIDASSYSQVILANCSDTVVRDGFSGDVVTGFAFGYCTNCSLENNTAMGNSGPAFHLWSSDTCVLLNNTALDNAGDGFHIADSDGCSLVNNTVTDNSYGFHIRESGRCTIANNTLVNNGIYIYGDSLSHWLHDVSENQVNGKPFGYFKDLEGASIDASSYSQVILANCSDTIVQDGFVENVITGFAFGYCTNCTLLNSTATGNSRYGFYLYQCGKVKLTNNTARSNSGRGFYIDDSNRCIVSNNTAMDNSGRGFHLDDSYLCTFKNNTATGNSGDGFLIDISVVNTFANNTATDNLWNGFYAYSSDSSVLTNNTATDNSRDGIHIGYSNKWNLTNNIISGNEECGICVKSYSSENRIFHNAIWNNTVNGEDEGSSNIWDDEVRFGNYWGDFDGGDTYTIQGSAGSSDRYPYPIAAFHSVVLDHPADIEYESGADGYSIIWHPSDPYPASYQILHNGTQIDGGIWNGSDIWISVDDLDVGLHNYTLLVHDEVGKCAWDTVLVMIHPLSPPVINSPVDIEYELGATGNDITWSPSDASPNAYEIYQNASLVDSGTWDGDDISVDIDGLEVGVYNYTLVVTDIFGYTASDMVLVTVISSDISTTETTTATETTTTTTTETTITETTPPDGIDPMFIILGVAAAIGVVVILVIFYVKKR